MIAGSRKAYFESVVGELLKAPQKDAAAVKLAETVSSQIRKYGDSPEAWDTLQKNIQNLRMALMRSALAGKNSLIHAADLWNNHFAPSPNTLPLKETACSAQCKSPRRFCIFQSLHSSLHGADQVFYGCEK